ncbi:hypothetical protein MiTe_04875 [Microcystis aeruginosa NIES-2520]|uniref:Uncharacterized protein n=1 Tax=Microcystis aeruginosa NIES-2520 TaxID=2303982 RepID=A0A5A5RY14_MICAE|nr:hypothetical protein MiTe_04875 [Microcystis aeruginosa NIES-2520]
MQKVTYQSALTKLTSNQSTIDLTQEKKYGFD